MILIIDNYDSFVFNLAHYFQMLGTEVLVVRNDKLTVTEILKMNLSGIVLSPGPCAPEDAGICVELAKQTAGIIPLLGVCLGHQAIGLAFGGQVIRSPKPQHGSSSAIYHQQQGIFADLPSPFLAGRYHSLIVNEHNLPQNLIITAKTEDGTIMGLEYRDFPIYGVQFHPESILTECGLTIIQNFISLIKSEKNPRNKPH